MGSILQFPKQHKNQKTIESISDHILDMAPEPYSAVNYDLTSQENLLLAINGSLIDAAIKPAYTHELGGLVVKTFSSPADFASFLKTESVSSVVIRNVGYTKDIRTFREGIVVGFKILGKNGEVE